jgi:hypothetical protein
LEEYAENHSPLFSIKQKSIVSYKDDEIQQLLREAILQVGGQQVIHTLSSMSVIDQTHPEQRKDKEKKKRKHEDENELFKEKQKYRKVN